MQPVSAPTGRPHAQAADARAVAVVLLSCKARPPLSHELASQAFIARGVAQLLGAGFDGHYDAGRHHQVPSLYFVPDDTLTSLAAAHQLGIRNARQLYGGVVPFPFVATKTITHPLVNARAQAPVGWSPEFAERVRTIALPGYSAFSLRDAQAAALWLLRHGTVRLKEAGGVGGAGQMLIRKRDEVPARLCALDEARVEREGVVLELNLARLTTYGVGLVHVGDLTAAYFGEQKLTFNNRGKEVYGGSSFTVVRGDFDALARWAPSAVIKTA
ncbi:MAG TPA: DUF3182 family protein, partial [Burkholderiaceae bacterium]|nr:DUF3182 family protein [Burkholderiaceae bacterium]